MLRSWNIFKALLPYFLLSALALLGAWVAFESVWTIWTGSLPELPDGAVTNLFILYPLLAAACFAAYAEQQWADQISSRKTLVVLALMIGVGIYLQLGVHNSLVEAKLRLAPPAAAISQPAAVISQPASAIEPAGGVVAPPAK